MKKGNTDEKKLLDTLDELNAKCSCPNPQQEEGLKRAQEWQKEHFNLFLEHN